LGVVLITAGLGFGFRTLLHWRAGLP
jgi:hypothetical protein